MKGSLLVLLCFFSTSEAAAPHNKGTIHPDDARVNKQVEFPFSKAFLSRIHSADVKTDALLVGGGFLLVLGLGIAGWYVTSSQSDHSKDEAEKVVGDEVREETTLEDYEELLRKVFQKGAQLVGPKVSKGAELLGLVNKKMNVITDKAKALIVDEFYDTAGSVAEALKLEEFMVFLDPDAAKSANIPSLQVMLAGLLVPVNLLISLACHALTILLVLLPVLLLNSFSELVDGQSPCIGVPGLRAWSRTVIVLAVTITVARLALMFKIYRAKANVQEKSAETRSKLVKAEHQVGSGIRAIDEVKDLFMCHSATLQFCVVEEQKIRQSPLAHVVGIGTFLWLLTAFWNIYLYIRYLSMPGVVEFSDDAKTDPTYCAAWVTASVAKVSILVTLMLFFANVMTVVFWLCDSSLNTDGVVNSILEQAKACDRFTLGVPVVQFFAKALLFRGTTDTLSMQLAAAMKDKSALSKELEDTEKRLAELKKQVEAKDGECDEFKSQMVNNGGGNGRLQAAAERIIDANSGIFEVVQQKGNEASEELRSRARALEDSTNEEINRVVTKLQDFMKQVQESEHFKEAQRQATAAREAAEAAAAEAKEKAMAASREAQHAAEELRAQAAAAADPANLQAMKEKALAQAQALKEQAEAAADDMANQAVAQAQAIKEQAAAVADDLANKAAAAAGEITSKDSA
jgi:hypothetical protein